MKSLINKLILLFALLSIASNVFAQNKSISLSQFNKNMGRYYKACLYMRNGIKKKSSLQFNSAMKLIHKDSIKVEEFTPTAVNTKDEVVIGTHLKFDYATAKKMRDDYIFVDTGNLRAEPTKFSKEEGKCFVMNRALKAKGKTTYKYPCPAGTNCLVVVCEPGGDIKLSVTNKNGVSIKTKSYEYDAVGYAKWVSEKDDEITFTIANTTNHAISFAVLAD